MYMKKMGRPPKPKADRKSVFVKVLLTPAEKKTLEAAAGDTDLSAWARAILLAAAGK
jgi:hypothetical protein